jgi:RNA polymerase sigma-70 factor (ECF subfamily)
LPSGTFGSVKMSADRLCQAEFTAIVRQHSARVYNLAFAILGDRTAAEDICQEVFLRIWRHSHSFEGRSEFTTWLHALTRNTAISERRKLALRGILANNRECSSAAESDSADPDDSHDFLATRRLARAIALLPPNMRVVVRLYYLESESVERVAAALDMPQGTVKTLLYRSRAQLKKLLVESHGGRSHAD